MLANIGLTLVKEVLNIAFKHVVDLEKLIHVIHVYLVLRSTVLSRADAYLG